MLSSCRPMPVVCSLNILQSFQHSLPGEWHPEQPCSGCIEYCVSDSSSDSYNGWFTSSLGCLVFPVEYHAFSLRYPGETRDLIAVKIPVKDIASFKFQLLGKSIAKCHSNTTFHLYQGSLRI